MVPRGWLAMRRFGYQSIRHTVKSSQPCSVTGYPIIVHVILKNGDYTHVD